jgi:hypothetical protein
MLEEKVDEIDEMCVHRDSIADARDEVITILFIVN